jgi:signal transduction histidine kinase
MWVKKNLPESLMVFADKHMQSSVIRNLISNAIKFTHPGGEIRITAESLQNETIISVNDNGVGISKDRIEKLFTIGGGDSTSGTSNEKGTGLGLILCKEFVEKHGGRIWAESVEGQGTDVFYTIPDSKLISQEN